MFGFQLSEDVGTVSSSSHLSGSQLIMIWQSTRIYSHLDRCLLCTAALADMSACVRTGSSARSVFTTSNYVTGSSVAISSGPETLVLDYASCRASSQVVQSSCSRGHSLMVNSRNRITSSRCSSVSSNLVVVRSVSDHTPYHRKLGKLNLMFCP